MRDVSLAISEAARATTLEDIGGQALPALARALDACPAFFAEASPDFAQSRPIAGEARGEFPGYLREYLLEDPIIQVAVSIPRPALILEAHVDRRTVRASRAYDEFHRVHDFEHHLLVRFFGDRLTAPGALAMGFTRGRRRPAFGSRDLRIAELVLPALHGAARRITAARREPAARLRASSVAGERGLTPAETRVLSVLLLGLSNREIARHLCISVDTVKTHVQRILRKLDVASRAQALAKVHDAGAA